MLHLALPYKINSVIKATKVSEIFMRRASKDSRMMADMGLKQH